MRDISDKPSSRRTARAQALLRLPPDCVEKIRAGTIDKGDPVEAARIAGMLAIKRCWELLPHCHPLPLHGSELHFETGEDSLRIEVQVTTIGPTGVEMEALTGASIAALTLYDMLKPHAGLDLAIENIHLLEKTGGKSEHRRRLDPARPAVICTVSTPIARGRKGDDAADALESLLTEAGFAPIERRLVPAEFDTVQQALHEALATEPALLLTLGGTGLAPDDCTVAATAPLLDELLPGVMEAARAFGQQRSPLALISRGIAGRAGRSLVLTLPGSAAGMRESWLAVAAGVVHAIGVLHRAK